MCPFPGGPNFHDTFHNMVSRMMHGSSSYILINYLQRIKKILEVIHRDQLFILNFESLTGNTKQDTLNRLLYFLGAGPVYQKSSTLPQSNSAESKCGENCEERELHEFLCSDFVLLNETYSKMNEGLLEFINSDPDRPISEPEFLPFKERISEKCKLDDGRLVYFN